MRNISLDASLEIYTNKTINPPRKIKNKIYENQFSLVTTQISMHRITVWVKMTAISLTGWDLFMNKVLKIIDKSKNILISSGFILFKIAALGAADEFLFSEVFMGFQFLVYKTNILI